MARRLRNRPRLEQFHFSELMTSRPDRHYAWLAQSDAHGKSRSSSHRQQHRRQEPTWMRVMAPVLPTASHFDSLSADALSMWQQKAALRSAEVFNIKVQWPGKAETLVPVPILSFAFVSAARGGKLTAEGIIQKVGVRCSISQHIDVQVAAWIQKGFKRNSPHPTPPHSYIF